MAALNIQIEVPNMGMYEIEELKNKLTLYAKKLIATSNRAKTKAISKSYKHEALAAILADEPDNDLRSEYIKDKYGV